MEASLVALAVAVFIGVVLLVILYLSVRVVQQYEKMIVFRLGQTNEGMVRDPGLRFLVPVIDRPVKVDVREQFIEVPSQTTITKDNAPINVDFLIYWRIVDPLKSVVNVANFAGALQGVATTTLRAVIGDISLDEVLSKRDQINELLRVKLDEQTERWGGKVTTVEIREIIPPRDVQDAMNRQLSAERTRRAVITESEGNRQAAINVAEGQKQSEILKAEGERQAAILRAEGFSTGADPDLRRRGRDRREDDGPPVPRGAQGARQQPLDEVRHPDRVHPAPRTDRRLRREGDGGGSRRRDGGSRRGRPGRRRREPVIGRSATRLLEAPRVGPEESGLKAALDALGGEVIRLRSRDGLKLTARWLPADPGPVAGEAGPAWVPDPYEAILLLHGWTGSVAPDLVELGPTLRRTAGVLGLDFRGHGGSDDAPTTFGLHEIEDVAGALAWLGERGIRRVALAGSSMGGAVAIAAVVGLGDGSLAQADVDPTAPAAAIEAPRPRIVGIVAESVAPDLRIPIANRIRAADRRRPPAGLAGRMFTLAGRRVGGDLRATEPGRIVGLLEPVPLLLIHGGADRTVRPADGRRLAALAGPSSQHWEVPGAEHGQHAGQPPRNGTNGSRHSSVRRSPGRGRWCL